MAMMQPQTSMQGANANTSVPQTQGAAGQVNPYSASSANAPPQLNPYKTGNQTQALQKTGMPTAQAVAKSAQNPNNRYAEGGIVGRMAAVPKPFAHHVSLPPHNIIRKAMGGPITTPITSTPIAPTGSGTVSTPIISNPTGAPPHSAPIGTPSQFGHNDMSRGNRDNRGPMHPATNRRFAEGGSVETPARKPILSPPTPDQINDQENNIKIDPATLKATTTALQGEPVTKGGKAPASNLEYNTKEQAFHDQLTPSDKEMLNMFDSLQPVQKKAKGGDVHSTIKNMPLKDVIKLLASHPDVGGMGGGNVNQPVAGAQMAAGGAVQGQNDPEAPHKKVANMKSEARGHGAGLLNMNADVPTYAQGGSINDPVKQTYNPQVAAGTLPPQQQQTGAVSSVGMASGGGLEGDTESDNIVGYGPDGSPIIQNADGTEQYGDINQLLDRPESAPTVGTGQTPTSGVSQNAANSVAGAQEAVATAPSNQMAKGGEEAGPPPGALSEEVADDIPAKLSQGEFVFSADVVRYYGLRLLNGMMEHARQSLTDMTNEGNIRSPGDNKNPGQSSSGTLSAFMGDSSPNMNAYNDDGSNKGQDQDQGSDDDAVSGILKECMGGGMNEGGSVPQTMSGGGPIEQYREGGEINAEENSLAKGGQVEPKGRDNMVSSHPKGGSTLMDYAKGGIVTSTSSSLAPKKIGLGIPTSSAKLSKPTGLEVPAIHSKPIGLPKMKKGGAMQVKNMMPPVPTQSVIGS